MVSLCQFQAQYDSHIGALSLRIGSWGPYFAFVIPTRLVLLILPTLNSPVASMFHAELFLAGGRETAILEPAETSSLRRRERLLLSMPSLS